MDSGSNFRSEIGKKSSDGVYAEAGRNNGMRPMESKSIGDEHFKLAVNVLAEKYLKAFVRFSAH